jgi:hypothetical protein
MRTTFYPFFSLTCQQGWDSTYLHVIFGTLCTDKLTPHKSFDLLKARVEYLNEIRPSFVRYKPVINFQDLLVQQELILFKAFQAILTESLDHDMLLCYPVGDIYPPLHAVFKAGDNRCFYDTFHGETVRLDIILFAC